MTGKRASKRRRDKRGKLRGALRLASAGLAVAAVTRELRQPKGERSWHGRIGAVPYDFRTPSPRRIKRSFWAPDDSRVFVPRAFGVGWSLNLAAVKHRVGQLRENAAGNPPRS